MTMFLRCFVAVFILLMTWLGGVGYHPPNTPPDRPPVTNPPSPRPSTTTTTHRRRTTTTRHRTTTTRRATTTTRRRTTTTRRPTTTTRRATTTTRRATTTTTRPPAGRWIPPIGVAWQWQLNTPVDQSVNVPIYDIDGFDNSKAVVDALHAKGRKVICYLDIGGAETYRPDFNDFPPETLGATVDGWPQERWVDVRQIDKIGSVMTARIDMCKNKGFDAVEPDMIEAYAAPSGFPITYQDQIRFNKFIAGLVRDRGMSVALKGDIEQARDLQPFFDFAINEECFSYDECDQLRSFVSSGKAVFHVEYNLPKTRFCSQAKAMKFSSMRKHLDLGAWRDPC